MIKPWHIIVLIVVLLIVFGSAKLPDIARSLGQSAKVMKKELRDLQDDDDPKQLPPSQAGPQHYSQPGQQGSQPQAQQFNDSQSLEPQGGQAPYQAHDSQAGDHHLGENAKTDDQQQS